MYRADPGATTFLLTDVVDSLRRWQQDPAAMREALRRHNAMVTEVVRRNGGRHYKDLGEGDSHVASFDQPAAAVRAACELQLAHLPENWSEGEPILFRAAIDTGEPDDSTDSDVFGAVVSRCGRIRSYAYGGQTLVTEETYRVIDDMLPAEIQLIPLGQHRFRDIDQPLRVFQIHHPALISNFPPIPTEDPVPNNLPAPPTTFLGRASELAAVAGLLATARLVTITGVGGSGKTRLALQAAAQRLDHYPDGVWMVDLAPVVDEAVVTRTLAGVMKVIGSLDRSLEDSLAEHMRHQAALLIFDNCERLLDPCADLIDTLLRQCPRLRVLATSREALNMPGEVTFHAPSLSLPPSGVVSAADAMRCDAVRLFVERAHAQTTNFDMSEDNVQLVVDLCRRLDGLPLAIELVAAHAGEHSLAELARQLDQGLATLPDPHRGVEPRHRTIEAAIRWSYDYLAPGEQALFDRLSVFANGFTAAAALDVANDEAGLDQARSSVDDLQLLVQRSFVVAEEWAAERTHLRLLETLRAFGQERLEAQGLADKLARRHALWYRDLSTAIENELTGPNQIASFDRLEHEIGNLRVALDTCYRADDRATGLDITSAIWRFWEARGHVSEARAIIERFLGQEPNTEDPGLEAKARRVAGILAYYQSDTEGAWGHFQAALDIGRKHGDQVDTAPIINNLALVALVQGRPDAARPLLEEALTSLRQAGDRLKVAGALNNLALTDWRLGNLDLAAMRTRESLSLIEEVTDAWSYGSFLTTRGAILQALGQLAAAREALDESLSVRRRINDRAGIAEALMSLANLEIDAGDLDSAESHGAAALEIAERDDDTWMALDAVAVLARVALERGHIELAGEQYRRCVAENRRRLPFLTSVVAHGWGLMSLETGELAKAAGYFQQALAAASSASLRLLMAEATSALARVAAAEGRQEDAGRGARQALAERLATGHVLGIARSLEDMAVVAAANGNAREAVWLDAVARHERKRRALPRLPTEQHFLDPLLATARLTSSPDDTARLAAAAEASDARMVAEGLVKASAASTS